MTEAQELVQYIQDDRSGVVVLDKKVRFRRRTRANPVSFDDFLTALQNNESIKQVVCHGNLSYSLRQEEWDQTIASFGKVGHLEELTFEAAMSLNVVSLSALASALEYRQEMHQQLQTPKQVGSAKRSISPFRSLAIGEGVVILGIYSEYKRFCRALGSSKNLESFIWKGTLVLCDRLSSATLDELICHGLSNCSSLAKVHILSQQRQPISKQAIQTLMELGHRNPLEEIALESPNWATVRSSLLSLSGSNNTSHYGGLKCLSLASLQVDETEWDAFLSALKHNRTLKQLFLTVRAGFTDLMGTSLARALKENAEATGSRACGLELVQLSDDKDVCTDNLGVSSVEAFTEVLRSNFSLQINLNVIDNISEDDHDGTVEDMYRLFLCESNLNRVGRVRLMQDTSTLEDWVSAFEALAFLQHRACHLDHVFTLVKMNPAFLLRGQL